ncbi:MAG: hypothetical protein U9P10_13705 [Thermodesulfobacteriota bacterium]|nr:hypothetical protein [Thermodesulfobacteriota bacterium]
MNFLETIKKLINQIPGAGRLYTVLMMRLFPEKIKARPLNRGECPGVDHDALRAEYMKKTLAGEPDSFVLYRIIGNDLPPRHRIGQTRENVQFILENERDFNGCEKRFVLNRIVDRDEEEKIMEMLDKAGYPFLHIPFEPEAYLKSGWDIRGVPEKFLPGTSRFKKLRFDEQGRIWMRLYRHKNNYVMNNNGARNAALAQGRQLAKWVLPWDGNCFITKNGWEEIVSSVKTHPELPCFVVPMARVTDNRLLLRSDYHPEALEEPQVIFRKDSLLSFNEACFYGRRPKVELLWRLGVPGKWDAWELEPWDLPVPGYAAEAGAFGRAGWVARLRSGRDGLEKDPVKRTLARVDAVKAMLDGVERTIEGNLRN